MLKIGDYVISKVNPSHIGLVVNGDAELILVNPVTEYPPFAFLGTYRAEKAADELIIASDGAKELIKILYED